jgi:hypothetical protein
VGRSSVNIEVARLETSATTLRAGVPGVPGGNAVDGAGVGVAAPVRGEFWARCA